MTKLPIISGQQAIRVFKHAGWAVVRQKGSHVVMTKAGKQANLSIPLHNELDPGALRGLIRDAGMSVAEFFAHL